MPSRLSDKIIKNTFFVGLGYLWDLLVVRLLLWVYIFHTLSTRDFGVWVFINLLVGYFSFMGFSVDSAFVKFISQHHTNRDFAGVNRILNTGLVFYGAVGLLIVAVTTLIPAPLLALLSVRESGLPSDTPLAQFVAALRIAGLAFMVLCLLRVFESVLDGLQRMELTNGLRLVASIPYAVFTILFLRWGWGVKGLLLRDLCAFSIQLLLAAFAAKWALPALRVNPLRYASRDAFKRLFGFGLKMHASSVVGMINYSIDRIFIGRFLDPGLHAGLVKLYEAGAKINYIARYIPGVMVGALVPAAAELEARDETDQLVELATRATKYLSLVAAPVMALVFVAAPHIVSVLVGERPLAAATARLLAMGYFAWAMSGGVSRVAVGMGRPGMLLAQSIVSLVLNLGLTLGLLLWIGYPGAAFGTTLASVLSLLLLWALFLRAVGKPLLPFMREACWPAVWSGFVAAGAVMSVAHLARVSVMGERLADFGVCAGMGAGFMLVYAPLVWLSRGLDAYDVQIAKRLWSRLAGFMRRRRAEEGQP